MTLSRNVRAHASELARAAVLAAPDGQREAAYALVSSHGQALRPTARPQAAKIAVPLLPNTLVSLEKGTSITATTQVARLFRTAQIAASPTFRRCSLYSTASASVFSWLAWAQGALERRRARATPTDLTPNVRMSILGL
jgi:ABC-type amino acid transport system permease subunit